MVANIDFIKRVAVIDDDPNARKGYKTLMDDMEVQPVFENGPLEELGSYVSSLCSRTDGVFCDYHLKKRAYAQFNGDELAARLYNMKKPVVICTNYTDWDVTLMRKHRRYIPVVLQGEAEPDDVLDAFRICINEFNGEYSARRKPRRQLVRVEECIEDEYAYVVVPGWDPHKRIRIQCESMPQPVLAKIKNDEIVRLHAKVNIGAEEESELYFTDWELN